MYVHMCPSGLALPVELAELTCYLVRYLIIFRPLKPFLSKGIGFYWRRKGTFLTLKDAKQICKLLKMMFVFRENKGLTFHVTHKLSTLFSLKKKNKIPSAVVVDVTAFKGLNQTHKACWSTVFFCFCFCFLFSYFLFYFIFFFYFHIYMLQHMFSSICLQNKAENATVCEAMPAAWAVPLYRLHWTSFSTFPLLCE